MTKRIRPGADQSARAGGNLHHETYPITTLQLGFQPECLTGYRVDSHLSVFPMWREVGHG